MLLLLTCRSAWPHFFVRQHQGAAPSLPADLLTPLMISMLGSPFEPASRRYLETRAINSLPDVLGACAVLIARLQYGKETTDVKRHFGGRPNKALDHGRLETLRDLITEALTQDPALAVVIIGEVARTFGPEYLLEFVHKNGRPVC